MTAWCEEFDSKISDYDLIPPIEDLSILDIIHKDVQWTFTNEISISLESSTWILTKIARVLPNSYVQGMNYIIAALLFHTGTDEKLAYLAFMTLFNHSDFIQMYDSSFSGFHQFIENLQKYL